MNPLLIIKALDLAYLGLTMLSNQRNAAAQTSGTEQAIRDLRDEVLIGAISAQDAAARLDALIGDLQAARKAAFAALPAPTFGANYLNDGD